MCIEPGLQPISNEVLMGATANTQDGAQLDITTNRLWGGTYQKTFFDIRVFNPHALSNQHGSLLPCFQKHKQTKKKMYKQRCREVEYSSFTPLVLSATGGLAKEATVFYERLDSLLASKWDTPYTALCAGCDADLASHCYVLQSNQSEEQSPHVGILSRSQLQLIL